MISPIQHGCHGGGIQTELNCQWQKLEEEITCPVCRGIFTDPITTPCLHTFCKECLKASIEVTMAELCPICRGVLSKASRCPTDFRIERLIKTFKQLKIKDVSAHSAEAHEKVAPILCCGKCGEELPGVSWCIECQVALCYDCNQIHGKWKEFDLHTSVTIEDYPNETSDSVIKRHSR